MIPNGGMTVQKVWHSLWRIQFWDFKTAFYWECRFMVGIFAFQWFWRPQVKKNEAQRNWLHIVEISHTFIQIFFLTLDKKFTSKALKVEISDHSFIISQVCVSWSTPGVFTCRDHPGQTHVSCAVNTKGIDNRIPLKSKQNHWSARLFVTEKEEAFWLNSSAFFGPKPDLSFFQTNEAKAGT
jgi:hypothetical protein